MFKNVKKSIYFVSQVFWYFTCALFLKNASSDFSGRCSGECLFLPSNFDEAQTSGLFNIKSANCSKSCWLISE